MSNIYDMSGKKKVIFEQNLEIDLTYKEIMQIIIQHATEEGCKEIFFYGGINMCPSDTFGTDKIDKKKEEDICNYKNISCAKCWTNAIKHIKENKNEK